MHTSPQGSSSNPLPEAKKLHAVGPRLTSALPSPFRSIFTKFDTSGDGALDATELRLALRVALGADLPLATCEEMVNAADQDGNGLMEFSEFVAVCKRF